jgi:hypothetical protein
MRTHATGEHISVATSLIPSKSLTFGEREEVEAGETHTLEDALTSYLRLARSLATPLTCV